MTLFKLFFFIGLIVISCSSYAQDDWEAEGQIEDAQFIIEKDKEIILPLIRKRIEMIPSMPDTALTKDLKFNIKDYKYLPAISLPSINAKEYKSDEEDNAQNRNHVTVGAGNFSSILAEGFASTNPESPWVADLNVHHLSFGSGPVQDDVSASSNTTINGNVSYSDESSVFSGRLGYQLSSYNFYGLEVVPDTGVFEQNFDRMDATLEYKKISEGFDYAFNVGFKNFMNDFEESEQWFQVGGSFQIYFSDSDVFNATFNGNISTLDQFTAYNRNQFSLNPYYQKSISDFTLRAGLTLVSDNDTTVSDDLFLFPDIQLGYNFNSTNRILLSVSGNRAFNTLNELSGQNPFLNFNQPIANTNKNLHGSVKFQTNLSQKLDFETGFSLSDYENGIFYVNDTDNDSRFVLVYDDYTQISLRAGFNYQTKDFSLHSNIQFNQFDTDFLSEAWHRPQFEANIIANWQPLDKLFIETQLIGLFGIKALEVSDFSTEDLGQVIDLNLSGEYFILDNGSIFLKLDNILSQKYERYLNYPVRSLQFKGGIVYYF